METECCTLVSAFCDLQQYQAIKRPRAVEFYLDSFIPLLAMEFPMVLFIEPRLVEFVTEQRRTACKSPKYVEKTLIIPWVLDASPYFAYKAVMDKAHERLNGWPSY